METETETNIKIACIQILLVVRATSCYIFVNPFTSYVTDQYLPQQEPMRVGGPKARRSVQRRVQLSARHVQIRQTAKIRNTTP